jgi:hypothetical protein
MATPIRNYPTTIGRFVIDQKYQKSGKKYVTRY